MFAIDTDTSGGWSRVSPGPERGDPGGSDVRSEKDQRADHATGKLADHARDDLSQEAAELVQIAGGAGRAYIRRVNDDDLIGVLRQPRAEPRVGRACLAAAGNDDHGTSGA